jgi:hypothetical protein
MLQDGQPAPEGGTYTTKAYLYVQGNDGKTNRVLALLDSGSSATMVSEEYASNETVPRRNRQPMTVKTVGSQTTLRRHTLVRVSTPDGFTVLPAFVAPDDYLPDGCGLLVSRAGIHQLRICMNTLVDKASGAPHPDAPRRDGVLLQPRRSQAGPDQDEPPPLAQDSDDSSDDEPPPLAQDSDDSSDDEADEHLLQTRRRWYEPPQQDLQTSDESDSQGDYDDMPPLDEDSGDSDYEDDDRHGVLPEQHAAKAGPEGRHNENFDMRICGDYPLANSQTVKMQPQVPDRQDEIRKHRRSTSFIDADAIMGVPNGLADALSRYPPAAKHTATIAKAVQQWRFPSNPTNTKPPRRSYDIDVYDTAEDQYGYTCALTAADRRSRWVTFIPMEDHTAQSVVEALLAVFYSRGFPTELFTDGAREFISAKLQGFLKAMNIRHIVTNYNAAANGLCERQHVILGEALRTMTPDLRRRRSKEVPKVAFAVNATTNTNLTMPPNRSETGEDATYALKDNVTGRLYSRAVDNINPYIAPVKARGSKKKKSGSPILGPPVDPTPAANEQPVVGTIVAVKDDEKDNAWHLAKVLSLKEEGFAVHYYGTTQAKVAKAKFRPVHIETSSGRSILGGLKGGERGTPWVRRAQLGLRHHAPPMAPVCRTPTDWRENQVPRDATATGPKATQDSARRT